MNRNPKISIIIPLYIITERFFTDLEKFKYVHYSNYEIIIVSDKKVEITGIKTSLVLTGKKKTGPAEKRDLALKVAKGEICAFIDDDAYPDKNWLKNAGIIFQDEKIAAVGGPGLTPAEDGFWEQVTGIAFQSRFCGGSTQHRFTKAKRSFVEDYPAYNLLVRTDVLKSVGGYGSYFYGGEDTFLCLKIIKKGLKILYDPEVVVYHHRRGLLTGYLQQIANVGTHRGFFVKKYPETSLYFTYFAPTILTLGFISGIVMSFFFPSLRILFLLSSTVFYLIAFFSVLFKSNPVMASLAAVEIILTHLIYGTFFIKGLFTKDLIR